MSEREDLLQLQALSYVRRIPSEPFDAQPSCGPIRTPSPVYEALSPLTSQATTRTRTTATTTSSLRDDDTRDGLQDHDEREERGSSKARERERRQLERLQSPLSPTLPAHSPLLSPLPPSLTTDDEPLSSLVSLGFEPCPDIDPDDDVADFTGSQNIHNVQLRRSSPHLAAAVGTGIFYRPLEGESEGDSPSSTLPSFSSFHDGYHDDLTSVEWVDRPPEGYSDTVVTCSSQMSNRRSTTPKRLASPTVPLGFAGGTVLTDVSGPFSFSSSTLSSTLPEDTALGIAPQRDSSRSPSPFVLEVQEAEEMKESVARQGVYPRTGPPSLLMDVGEVSGAKKAFGTLMEGGYGGPRSAFSTAGTVGESAATAAALPGYRSAVPPSYYSEGYLGSNVRQLQQLQKVGQQPNLREQVSSRLYPTLPSMTSDNNHNHFTLPRIRDLTAYHYDRGTANADTNNNNTNPNGNPGHYYNQDTYYHNADSWVEAPNSQHGSTIGSSSGYQAAATLSSASAPYWESFLNTSPPSASSSLAAASMGLPGPSSLASPASSAYHSSHGPSYPGNENESFAQQYVGNSIGRFPQVSFMTDGDLDFAFPSPPLALMGVYPHFGMSIGGMGVAKTTTSSFGIVSRSTGAGSSMAVNPILPGRKLHYSDDRQEIQGHEPDLKICSNCGTTESPSWRRCPKGQILLCNACGLYHKLHGHPRPFKVTPEGKIKIDRMLQLRGPCDRCRTTVASSWKKNVRGETLCVTCIAIAISSREEEREPKGDGGRRGAREDEIGGQAVTREGGEASAPAFAYGTTASSPSATTGARGGRRTRSDGTITSTSQSRDATDNRKRNSRRSSTKRLGIKDENLGDNTSLHGGPLASTSLGGETAVSLDGAQVNYGFGASHLPWFLQGSGSMAMQSYNTNSLDLTTMTTATGANWVQTGTSHPVGDGGTLSTSAEQMSFGAVSGLLNPLQSTVSHSWPVREVEAEDGSVTVTSSPSSSSRTTNVLPPTGPHQQHQGPLYGNTSPLSQQQKLVAVTGYNPSLSGSSGGPLGLSTTTPRHPPSTEDIKRRALCEHPEHKQRCHAFYQKQHQEQFLLQQMEQQKHQQAYQQQAFHVYRSQSQSQPQLSYRQPAAMHPQYSVASTGRFGPYQRYQPPFKQQTQLQREGYRFPTRHQLMQNPEWQLQFNLELERQNRKMALQSQNQSQNHHQQVSAAVNPSARDGGMAALLAAVRGGDSGDSEPSTPLVTGMEATEYASGTGMTTADTSTAMGIGEAQIFPSSDEEGARDDDSRQARRLGREEGLEQETVRLDDRLPVRSGHVDPQSSPRTWTNTGATGRATGIGFPETTVLEQEENTNRLIGENVKLEEGHEEHEEDNGNDEQGQEQEARRGDREGTVRYLRRSERQKGIHATSTARKF